MSDQSLTIVIASPLEPEHVQRIEGVDQGRLRVVFEPDLLPVPRYAGDHDGIHRDLDTSALERWRSIVAQADILFDFDWLDPAQLPQRAPKLRWIQATSSGIGEFLARTGLDESPIVFTTAAGVHAAPLAEFVVLGLLYFVKDIPLLEAWKTNRHWERRTTDELAGRRILLVGLGRVGRQIAKTCSSLGLEVWAIKRNPASDPSDGVDRLLSIEELRDALPRVDALVLACPYTPETHHLIGPEELRLLPEEAIVVNVARGAVIDELALIDTLRDGRLKGAALDVFEEEPLPTDNPLWGMRNVLISPHSASTVEGENERITGIFVENLRRYLDGHPLINRFDPRRGY